MRNPIRRHGHGRIRARRRNRCLPVSLPSFRRTAPICSTAKTHPSKNSNISPTRTVQHPHLYNHSFLRSHPRHTTLGTGHLYRNWYAKWIFAKGNPVLTVAICINSHQSMPTSRPRLPSATHLLQKTRLRSWVGEHRLT